VGLGIDQRTLLAPVHPYLAGSLRDSHVDANPMAELSSRVIAGPPGAFWNVLRVNIALD
jgi:hypothetical protein